MNELIKKLMKEWKKGENNEWMNKKLMIERKKGEKNE